MAGIRLLLDEDVPILLARTLRQRGHDVAHATEVGLRQTHDRLVFEAAAASGRTLVAHNVVHYMPLVNEYGRAGRSHAGIVFVHRPIEFRDFFARALRFLSERTPADMRDATVWL